MDNGETEEEDEARSRQLAMDVDVLEQTEEIPSEPQE